MIEVKNLSYKAGKKAILSNISFDILDSGFYGIIGNNGSGKTTLLRCLSKTLDISSNTVFINKRDINAYSSKQLAKQVSVVAQRTNFMFDFSAHQIVMMGRCPYQKRLRADSEQDFRIVKQSMEQTATWHLRNTSIKVLSGGELQRVIIARALAQQTPIMMLDEPISNLDIKHQFEIMNLLQSINRENHTTIIIIIHDLNLALKYSESLIVLKDGNLFANAPTKETLTKENIKSIFSINAQLVERNSDDEKYILFNSL